jgi:hypothetical protein
MYTAAFHLLQSLTLHPYRTDTNSAMSDNIDTNISGVERIFGRVFNDKSFCAEAIQMQSAAGAFLFYGGSSHHVPYHRRLELMGDRIIDTVLCQKWFQARDADGNEHA